MSPSSKSKSKDKRAGKEQKASSKTSGSVNGTSGIPASAYNPVLGTFHTLEASPTSSLSSLQVNGRFRNIDDTDDNSGSTNGSGADYDSASNNDSRSVESEEHKEKTLNAPVRQEVIPGADNDKREKIRQKNERKHQRQKEKRAQELHERCSGYLMSRKLEALAQQLVAMGFSAERATMALILNEGKAEEAVAWLFEGGEEADNHKDRNLDTEGNLKIDISEELARISEMEVKFKCSKPEVERAIVACEGDLEKAEETLQAQKQDSLTLSIKPEETGDPPSMSNGKISLAINQNPARLQQRPTSTIVNQPRKDDKELSNAKASPSVGPMPKILNKSVQPVTRAQPKLDWGRAQQMTLPTEKRWPAGSASSSPSASYSLASPLQAPSPPTKIESRHALVTPGNEHKIAHSVREPVVMMQRPQSVNGKLMAPVNTSISSSPPGGLPGWYPSTSDMMKLNGVNPYIPTTRSVSPNDLTSNHQLYQQAQFHQQHNQFVPGTSPVELQAASRAMWKRVGSSPTLPVAASLGLFSGLGSTCSSGSTSPVDWHTGGSMSSCDYNNIDWSLDRTFLPPTSKPASGFWQGLGSSYQPKTSSRNIYDSNATTIGVKQAMRPPSSNGNGVSIAGYQDGGSGHSDTSSVGSREWTSPFEGKDLFSVPRLFVSSPSL